MVISINNGNAISLRSSFPSGKILFPQTTEVVFAEMSYFIFGAIIRSKLRYRCVIFCQALVPSPGPQDQILKKSKSPIGTGGDTKITWATTPPT